MIITEQKGLDEILGSLNGHDRVFLVGCGICAATWGTGCEKETAEMSALLTDSIWKLWMITGDKRCPASLAMYAKFLERHAVTPDGRGVYYMANSPGRGKSINPEFPPHNMEACYILAMGYYLSGGADAGPLAKIATLWPPIMKDGANRPGRKFTWRFRETSMLIWFLQNAK